MKSSKAAEPFVMLPLGLLDSEAFRSLSINGWRFIRFLMVEHMRHAGKANGLLVAPRRQLWAVGIGPRHVSPAIEETERFGLVDCKRGVGRRPNAYALTWLQLADGSAPSNRWSGVVMSSQGNSLQMSSEGIPLGCPKGTHNARSDIRRELTKGQNKGARRETPYKRVSYQEGAQGKKEQSESKQQPQPSAFDTELTDRGTARRCPWYVTGSTGFRLCGEPVRAGDYCAEHSTAREPRREVIDAR
jgi:hypothetical protein